MYDDRGVTIYIYIYTYIYIQDCIGASRHAPWSSEFRTIWPFAPSSLALNCGRSLLRCVWTRLSGRTLPCGGENAGGPERSKNCRKTFVLELRIFDPLPSSLDPWPLNLDPQTSNHDLLGKCTESQVRNGFLEILWRTQDSGQLGVRRRRTPSGLFWGSFGPSWNPLGPSWGLLGSFWGAWAL